MDRLLLSALLYSRSHPVSVSSLPFRAQLTSDPPFMQCLSLRGCVILIGFPCLDLFFVLSTPLLFSPLLLLCQDLGECERQEKGVMHGCPFGSSCMPPRPSLCCCLPVALPWCSWIPMRCGEKPMGEEGRCEVSRFAFFKKMVLHVFHLKTPLLCHKQSQPVVQRVWSSAEVLLHQQ